MGKDDLKQLIAQARLNEAVDRLLEQIKAYSPASKSDRSVGKLSDILIINSGKLHGLQHDKMLGILDRQNEQLTLAQVQQAILYVIDELPDEFWNASLHHQTVKLDNNNGVEPEINSTFETIDLLNLDGNENIALQNLTNTTVNIGFKASDRKPQPSSNVPSGDSKFPTLPYKKLIYLLSSLLLIALVVSIVYFTTINKKFPTTPVKIVPKNATTVETANLQMVFVRGGKFVIGDDNSGEKDEKPALKVDVSDFKIGKYEVTQKQYTDIMGKNPSDFKGCDNCPVESVSWDDVQEFLEKLNQKTGKTYRLPTETEWEYACRAGTTTIFNTGNDLITSQANYNGNNPYNNNTKGEYRKRTMIVGSFAPNDWGLYDMHGNVWEWCSDMYDENYYAKLLNDNHKVSSAGYRRVIRGGAWNSDAKDCRAANRDNTSPGNIYFAVGFRLVSDP